MDIKEYNQPTNMPVPKVMAVGGAGAIVTAIVGLLTLLGIIIPPDVSEAATRTVGAIIVLVSAFQTIIMFLAGYFKKDAKPSQAIPIIQSNPVAK